jgi:hypothetical protein
MEIGKNPQRLSPPLLLALARFVSGAKSTGQPIRFRREAALRKILG